MTATGEVLAQQDLEAFLGRFVVDLGAAMAGANVVLGDRLGLYRALAAPAGASPADIAKDTETDARYVREWLCGQAAGGYVEYDPKSGHILHDGGSGGMPGRSERPGVVPSAFQIAASLYKDDHLMQDAFHTGAGVGWDQHHGDLFEGTERFFRAGYLAGLVEAWLPALAGVEGKLLTRRNGR